MARYADEPIVHQQNKEAGAETYIKPTTNYESLAYIEYKYTIYIYCVLGMTLNSSIVSWV